MASIKKLAPMTIAKGCILQTFVDESKPVDSTERCWSETTYDGLPDSDVLEVPLHWHKLHDEHWLVLEGEIETNINGKKRLIKPSDGDVFIPRRAVHGAKATKGVRMTVKEFTDPGGDFKEAFFRDLTQQGDKGFGFWLAMRCFYDGDTYAAMGMPFQFLDEMFITVIGGLAHFIAPAKPASLANRATKPKPVS